MIHYDKVNRYNLKITISKDQEKFKALMQLLKSEPFSNLKSIVVYCNMKRTTESVSNYLCFNGVKSVAYHAGLLDEQRIRLQ